MMKPSASIGTTIVTLIYLGVANGFSPSHVAGPRSAIGLVHPSSSKLVVGHPVPIRPSSSRLAIAEPSFDGAVLQQLEREMMEAARKREKLERELQLVQTKLEAESQKLTDIEQRKKQYLDGAKLGVIPAERSFSETTARSAVKAFAWRIIAGSVTFITALRFSGSLAAALKIVGSDFFSKSFTMFLGERLMNKSKAGRKGGADNVGRSLAKALLWRLFAIANTLTMAIFIAKDLSIASKIAGSDAIIKTAMMFGYERVWAKIEWGKEYEIEFAI